MMEACFGIAQGRPPFPENKKPRLRGSQGQKLQRTEPYFAANTFAACDFARDAAFLCTTPDFTALSIAET